MALLEKRGFLYNHSGDFPQVILIVLSHVPNIDVIGITWLHFGESIANTFLDKYGRTIAPFYVVVVNLFYETEKYAALYNT